MTLTNYVATKDLFQALIRAKRGTRPSGVTPPGMPKSEAPARREAEPAVRKLASGADA